MSPNASRSPTPGSPAKRDPATSIKSDTVVHPPPWLVRLLTPLAARWIARGLAKRHPGITAEEIAAGMRAEAGGRALGADEERMIQAVVARVPREEAEKPVSAWVLVAANLVPVAGVLFWGWSAFALILLFWMENVVVGLFFLLRMLCADPADPALWLAKLFMVPFFCFHYGMFTAFHGMFVFMLFGEGDYRVQGLQVLEPALRAASDYGLWLAAGVLLASHFFSFLWNYLYRGEFRSVQLRTLMAKPYHRIVVLHVGIILGGMAATVLGAPVWALLVLLAIKIALDLKAHVKEHSGVIRPAGK
jgi:hypothetical protein